MYSHHLCFASLELDMFFSKPTCTRLLLQEAEMTVFAVLKQKELE